MKLTRCLMRGQFLLDTDLMIVLIDQNHPIGHCLVPRVTSRIIERMVPTALAL